MLNRTEFDPMSTAAKTGIVHLYYGFCALRKGLAFVEKQLLDFLVFLRVRCG